MTPGAVAGVEWSSQYVGSAACLLQLLCFGCAMLLGKMKSQPGSGHLCTAVDMNKMTVAVTPGLLCAVCAGGQP
jgi:hypothetical protein